MGKPDRNVRGWRIPRSPDTAHTVSTVMLRVDLLLATHRHIAVNPNMVDVLNTGRGIGTCSSWGIPLRHVASRRYQNVSFFKECFLLLSPRALLAREALPKTVVDGACNERIPKLSARILIKFISVRWAASCVTGEFSTLVSPRCLPACLMGSRASRPWRVCEYHNYDHGEGVRFHTSWM